MKVTLVINQIASTMELLKEWTPITHDFHGRLIEAHAYLTNFECAIDVEHNVLMRNIVTGKLLKQKDSYDYKAFQPRQGKQLRIFAHRLICLLWKENPESKPCVDHIDRKPHNNKLSNLRWCTASENMQNRGKRSNNTTGEQCIYETTIKDRTFWRVQIVVKGKKPYSKYFKRDPTSDVIPAEVIEHRDMMKRELHPVYHGLQEN
jgi:hypothetical protein